MSRAPENGRRLSFLSRAANKTSPNYYPPIRPGRVKGRGSAAIGGAIGRSDSAAGGFGLQDGGGRLPKPNRRDPKPLGAHNVRDPASRGPDGDTHGSP